MSSRPNQPSPGDVVLTRADGAVIVYDGELDDGTDVGHIVTADGRVYPAGMIINISKFNVWQRPGPQSSSRRFPSIPEAQWTR